MSATEKPVYRFVQPERDKDGNLLARGELKYGLTISGKAHKTFEMVEPTTGDMFEAEQQANVGNALAFNGAMMALQLRRVGDFEGPFTLSMIGRLKPSDYNLLRFAQVELDRAGEAE